MKLKMLYILSCLVLLVGCSRMTAAPPVLSGVNKDIHTEIRVDSVVVDRWHSVLGKNDTVFVHDSIDRLVYRNRAVHDTVVDSIPYPVFVDKEVEVPAELSQWQQLLMAFGKLGLVMWLCVLVYVAVKVWRKFR